MGFKHAAKIMELGRGEKVEEAVFLWFTQQEQGVHLLGKLVAMVALTSTVVCCYKQNLT